MDVKSAQSSVIAALHYAAWQLSRKGWNVMATARNAKGSDLFCVNDDESIKFGVQSKGLSKRAPVGLGTDLKNLRSEWWLITINAKQENPVCFILSLDEIKKLIVFIATRLKAKPESNHIGCNRTNTTSHGSRKLGTD